MLLQCNFFERRLNDDYWPINPVGQGKVFKAHRPQGRPARWRRLAVEVTPQKIRTYWENDTGKLVPAKGFTTAQVEERARAMYELNILPGLSAPVQPRLGLGLFVYRSRGSFRRVILEPVPANP